MILSYVGLKSLTAHYTIWQLISDTAKNRGSKLQERDKCLELGGAGGIRPQKYGWV